MPQISVIMAAYIDIPDKLTWLGEAIESVRSQSLQDWELIIVDDCSPYDLGELKWKYQNEPRIRWFRTAENSGPAQCRNVAVALVDSDTNEYPIIALDSDDQLGTPQTLEIMLSVWEQDKSKIIYGDLQRLVMDNGHFQRQPTIRMPSYTFERAMNLAGIMPVTALHSLSCHESAGGWKPELEAGLEDVEYWIAAGKAGFCGHKINDVTLIYRRQQDSRAWKLQNLNYRENEMRKLIQFMHEDVYTGEYPMGCCGGNKQTTAAAQQQMAAMTASVNGRITPLQGASENDVVWVEYKGPKKASFRILGTQLRTPYTILGTGHKLQVYRADLEVFRKAGRGQDFLVGIPDPIAQPEQPLPEPGPTLTEHRYKGPAPKLATVERLDQTAAQARGIELEAAPAPLPPVAALEPPVTPTMTEQAPPVVSISASDFIEPATVTQHTIADLARELRLGSNITGVLQIEYGTVELLALATPSDLTQIKGIGAKRAEQIIKKAYDLSK